MSLMLHHEIQAELAAIEQDVALCEAINFNDRAEAIDAIEFGIIDRIEGLPQTTDQPEALIALQQRAQRVKRQLEAVDAALFQRLRADIRTGSCTGAALKAVIDQYTGRHSSRSQQQDAPDYDNLDLFINGLLRIQAVPVETQAREPEMVYYQKTPARIILELVEQAQLTREDRFYDLGSGMGHVPILVNLLSGALAAGVEFEPAYCDFARACAAELHLSRVEFINADARTADYSAGSVFFMYTPFTGSMLQAVLDRLRGAAQARTIRLFTYGPCTPHVARQAWLTCVDGHGGHLYKLGVFRSR